MATPRFSRDRSASAALANTPGLTLTSPLFVNMFFDDAVGEDVGGDSTQNAMGQMLQLLSGVKALPDV